MNAGAIRNCVIVALAGMLSAGFFLVLKQSRSSPAAGRVRPSSYAELIGLPKSELGKVDIALMNLLCADGLPGGERLDIDQCLSVLDAWADMVRNAERKYMSQFRRDPARYDHSLAKFRTVNLALTLKQDLGCDYNQELVNSGMMSNILSTRFFRSSSDLFLHGFIEKRKGSCASLPVLMVAVGRRCGYPLFLVASKGHLFFRWEDSGERFNVETAMEGVDSRPDSYYREWPHPFSDEELRTEKYLKSLSPGEELGLFAQIRAACLQENRRNAEAAQAYETALRSFPESRYVKAYLVGLKGAR